DRNRCASRPAVGPASARMSLRQHSQRARRRKAAAPRISPKTSQPPGSGVTTAIDPAAGFVDVGGLNSCSATLNPLLVRGTFTAAHSLPAAVPRDVICELSFPPALYHCDPALVETPRIVQFAWGVSRSIDVNPDAAESPPVADDVDEVACARARAYRGRIATA